MKNKILILTLIIMSCKTEFISEINVQSNKPEGTKIYLIESKDNVSFSHFYKALDSTYTDKNGSFSFKFNQEKPKFYQLKVRQGSKYFNLIYNVDLYVEPGEEIKINIGDNIDIIDINQHNPIQIELENTYNTQNKSNSKKYALSPIKHEERVRNLTKNLYSIVEKHDGRLPKGFKKYLNAKIKLREINENWNYLKYHNYYSGIDDGMSYMNKDSIPKNWNLSVDKKLNNYNYLDTYKSYITGFVNHLFEVETSNSTDIEKWKIEFKSKINIIKNNLQGINADVAFFSITEDFWKYLSTSSIEFYKLLDDIDVYFSKNFIEKKFYKTFKIAYDSFNNIAPKKTAPNFTLKNKNGSKVSLSEYKGNVVYLNFWGTWCAPCIKSIPQHKLLQEKYKNQKVVFLYVALEGSDDGKYFKNWKKFLSDRNFEGNHLIAKNQFNNLQIAPYLVSAAPTYVLIGKDGSVEIPRADGPSKISESIDKLLLSK